MKFEKRSNLEANGCDVVDGVCPPYRLLERTEHYDIRWYPSYKWASTIIMSQDRFLSQWQGLSRLENFFSGQNDQGLFMNATLPLLSQIKHSRHPGVLRELRDITFSLPIPPSHQSNPPLPLTGDVSPPLTPPFTPPPSPPPPLQSIQKLSISISRVDSVWDFDDNSYSLLLLSSHSLFNQILLSLVRSIHLQISTRPNLNYSI